MDSIVLGKSELLDSYRKKCFENELNSLARGSDQYIPVSSPNEFANHLEVCLSSDLLRDATIVILHPSADSGFPHTRAGNVICMPAGYSPSLAEDTLFHESFHLDQKARSNVWKSYHIKEGWWPVPASSIPDRWVDRCRINPDTLELPFWSWQTHYIPLPLFQNEMRPTLSECDVRWYDIRNGALFSSPPSSFVKRYGGITYTEHPNEVSAVELTSKGIRSMAQLSQVLF
jgi:hypothetical protein